MDIAKKQDVLNKKAEQHKTMDTAKKEKLLEKCKEEPYSYYSSRKTLDSFVEQFKKKIMEGIYDICYIYDRTPKKNLKIKHK